jgi:Arc/MetJ-type ribon-helix-helix transcriptional regulator
MTKPHTMRGVQGIKPRPAPQQHFSVRLPPAEIRMLDDLARSAGCLRSDLVRQALRAGLKVLTDKDEESMP